MLSWVSIDHRPLEKAHATRRLPAVRRVDTLLPADLFRGGSVALAPEEYFRFWDALDAEAEDPNLAAAIGQAISVEMFSPPLFAALCSPNLEVAARRIATYKPLIGPMRVAITLGGAGLTVSYRWPAGMTPPSSWPPSSWCSGLPWHGSPPGTTCGRSG